MAVDFFLKLDGINGESQNSKHTNEIALLSWGWGAQQVTTVSGTGGSGGAGKANLAPLHVIKQYDAASVQLFKALLSGTHIASGVLTANKAGGGGAFLTVTLSDLFVISIQSTGSSEVPTEDVSFSYGKIKIEYSKQSEAGVLTAAGSVSYDIKANKVS